MTGSVAVKPEQTTYIFASRANSLLVLLTPYLRKVHPDGTSEQINGKTVQFEHGRVEIDDVLARRTGYASADDMAAAMRAHDQFQDGTFMELQIEPPAPSPEDDLAEIMRLVTDRGLDDAGRIEALTELYVQERANFNRPVVVDTIAAALLGVEGRDPHEATRPVTLGIDPEPQEPVEVAEPQNGGPQMDDDVDRSHLAAGLRTD